MADIERYNRIIRNLYGRAYEQGKGALLQNKDAYLTRTLYTDVMAARYTTGYATEVLRDRPKKYFKCDIETDTPSRKMRNHGYSALVGTEGKIGPNVLNVASLLKDSLGDGAVLNNGSNAYVQITDAYTVGAITLECLFYIYPGSYANGKNINLFAQFDFFNAANRFGVVLYNDSGSAVTSSIRLQVKSQFTDGVNLTNVGTVSIGVVHHFALVRDAQKNIKVYIDGAQLGSTITATGADFTHGALGVAAYSLTQPGGGSQLTGGLVVDEAAYYAHALPESRIVAHYNAWLAGGYAVPNGLAYASIAPAARYYANLTTGGSNTSSDDSAYKFATGVTVTYSSAVVDETQMWGVICLRPDWASGSPPATPSFFRFADDANNRLTLTYETGNWVFRRKSAGAGADVTVAGTHAQYDDVIVVFAATSTQLKLSINGAAFTTVGNTSIPTLSAATIDIGNGDGPSNSWFHWMALGTGTLTDADAATLNALGRYDPEWKDLPSMEVALPSFLWHCYDNTHVPTGVWGESVYA